jgi:hypothetical protein
VCGGKDRRTVVRIYLDQVVGYTKEEDRLPLLQIHPNLVQTLTCVTDPVTETGSFALTFGGQVKLILTVIYCRPLFIA